MIRVLSPSLSRSANGFRKQRRPPIHKIEQTRNFDSSQVYTQCYSCIIIGIYYTVVPFGVNIICHQDIHTLFFLHYKLRHKTNIWSFLFPFVIEF